MIRADGSQYAHYKTSEGQPGPVRPVLAWDDMGFRPLVMGRHGLVAADSLDNFDQIRHDAAAVVGAVPGGGWLIDCTDADGHSWTTPIVAWTVHADATATPLTSDGEGVASDATEALASYRIYHPDETLPVPPEGS